MNIREKSGVRLLAFERLCRVPELFMFLAGLTEVDCLFRNVLQA